MTTGQNIVPAGADFPTSDSLRRELATTLMAYIDRNGPIHGPSDDKKSDNKPVPGPSMPGHVHLAISSIAGHPALPYGGNASALIRDLIYMGLAAWAHVLLDYNPDDPDAKFVEHVIVKDESLRKDLFMDHMSLGFGTNIAAATFVLRIAMDAHDLPTLFTRLEGLFLHASGINDQSMRHHFLMQLHNTPEINEALNTLTSAIQYVGDKSLEGWVALMTELGD